MKLTKDQQERGRVRLDRAMASFDELTELMPLDEEDRINARRGYLCELVKYIVTELEAENQQSQNK